MDPYKVLEVDKHATLEEIQRAYRAKARKHHPDLGGDGWAFQQVRAAYEQLVKLHAATPNASEIVVSSEPAAPPPKPQPDTTRPPPNQGFSPPPRPSATPWWHFAFSQLPLQNESTAFILVNVLDILVTYVLIRFGGVEANPVARFFLVRWGFNGIIWFKLAMVAFVTVLAQIVARRNPGAAQRLLLFGTIVVGAVVCYGIFLFFRHFAR